MLEALKSLKWLNVKEKLLFNEFVMMYKCMNDLTPKYLSERFHQLDTRQKNDLALPKCRLVTGQKAFAFRGVKMYNTLPKEIRETESLSVFKKRILEKLFNS